MPFLDIRLSAPCLPEKAAQIAARGPRRLVKPGAVYCRILALTGTAGCHAFSGFQLISAS
ncbi:MAG: hypothetical protein HZC23_03370 [Rhodocyclales bacterium]|nr:hypothetical protein [Rhodocyclales bacterium]